MKKCLIVIFLISMGLLVSCSKYTTSPKEKLHTLLQEMEEYEAEVEVTFQTSEKTTTQRMKQKYEMQGSYTLTVIEPKHLEGYTTSYDGSRIIEYDPKQDKSIAVEPNPVRNQVLFGTFVHNYLQLQNTAEYIKEENEVLYITQDIPGNYKYMAKQKIQFDKNTLKPVEIIIYGEDDKVAITIKFLNFTYNP